MEILYICIVVGVLLFGFVVLFGAPYLPTLSKQTELAFEMLSLKQGQLLLELGCGDGRVVKAAAQRGIRCVGYELNPILVCVAKLNTWKYRDKVTIIWGDYWKQEWPPADAIFVFLLDKYMKKLDKKIVQSKLEKVKLISFAFEIPDKKPTRTENGLFLYQY